MKKLDATALMHTLDRDLPDGRWRSVLEVLEIVGVADSQQLQEITGLSRDRLAAAMEKLQAAAAGGPPILYTPAVKVIRPGRRGGQARLFCLGESGAALLRHMEHPQAEECGLVEPTALAHAVAMLDVRLQAQRAGLPVKTDAVLFYGDEARLRPDNLVTLPDGTQAIFELEQLLTAQHLARALESLEHKAAFFEDEPEISTGVRVLFNLPRGRDYERTLQVWRKAASLLARRQPEGLPFHLYAMPLEEFKARPDWNEPPDEGRWIDLTLPAFNAGPVEADPEAALPQELHRYSHRESRLVLTALWQVFNETLAARPPEEIVADPAFFEVMGMIHVASHGSHLRPIERAAFPQASIYLLKQYLSLHPPLRKQLQREMGRGMQSTRWNPMTINHRIQVVCEAFLKYHGFSDDGGLSVYATAPDWTAREPQTFQVRVVVDPQLLVAGDGLPADRSRVREAEASLAWVLRGLFAYAGELDLPRPAFW